MNSEKEDIYFNKIFIIQSLSNQERQTGEEIERKIRYLSYRGLPIDVRLTNVTSKNELFEVFAAINEEISTGILPFIHFEVHGSKAGLVLSDNTLIEWSLLRNILLELNIKTQNNLFISSASCYGGYLLKIYKPWEPCPFYGYIGPTEEVLSIDLEASFSSFFETLLTENDFAKAIRDLQLTADENSKVYAFLNCYAYFDSIHRLFTEENNDPEFQEARINDLVKNYGEQHRDKNLSSEDIRRQVEKLVLTEDEEFERWKDIFLHRQLHSG